MFDIEERKQFRMKFRDTIDERRYNSIIGCTLLYGFVANIALVLLARNFFMQMNPIVFLIAYFVLAITGSIVVNASDNPIFSFIGYNMICIPIGGLLAICIPSYPMENIIAAIIATGLVTAMMLCLGMIFPKFFSRIGTVLFISLFLGFIVEIFAVMFGYGGDIFNWLFVIIFSLYIGYDWHKAQEYPKTIDNAVDSAVDLYLDIINLFIRLLEILSKKK